MIGLTRTAAVILSQYSMDSATVNREMFTYVPPVLTLGNSTFCAQRVYIFGMVLITKSDYLFIINPYPTAFPYGNGMVLHFYQQQESSTTKTVHKVINKRLKTYV